MTEPTTQLNFSQVNSTTIPAFLALGCVGFLATAPAYAEAADDNSNEQIIVNGHQEIVALPKAVAPLINTPRSVVVVDAQIIKETGSASLVDALRTVPGITFGAAEGGNPIGDRPFIRGFDSQGSTYLDGVRDLGAQTREIFAVDSIQVVRGSDSTLGGRGSAGGTLNIISKTPQARNFATLDLSGGTADYKRAVGDVNYQLSDSVAVRLAAMWHDQDVAGRDAIWQRRWGVAPSITVGLGTPTRMTFGYYHLTSHELPDSGIPFLYTIGNTPNLGTSYSEPAIGQITTLGGQTGTVDRSTYYGLANRDFRDAKTDQLTMRVEHDFGGITLRNTSRYSHNSQAYIYTLPDDSQGNVFGTTVANTGTNQTSGGYVWTRTNTRYGYDNSLTNQTDLFGKFRTGSVEHSFSVGAEFSWEKARRGVFVTRGNLNASGVEILSNGSTISPRCNTTSIARYYCASLFNPNPNAPWVNYASDTSNVTAPIVKMLPIEETQNDANTQGVYAFDSITLTPALILNLGARVDRFESATTPGQAANATSTVTLSRTDTIFNYQAGLVFKPTKNTSVYASIATAATPPNSLLGEGQEGNGLGAPVGATPGSTATALAAARAVLDTLRVEKTKSYEVGAKADLFGGGLSLTAALFQTETKNARVTSDANTVTFIGERRIRGAEIGFNGNITPAWSVFGGYTYLDAKIVDGGFSTLTAAAVTGQAAKTVLVTSVNTGRQFPQTAKHSFTIWSNYKVIKGLTIGGGAFYTSRVFGGYADNRSATQDSAGVVTIIPATKIIERSVPEYWRFDARASYDFNRNVGLSVNVQNLTDKVYFNQTYTSHYASIAPGRSAFATLSVRY
ncbi:TonB-dependent siderophore receptor [soil metagenome]